MQKETIRKNKIFPPPIKPYDYQIPIIKKIMETILEGKNGLVIQPTATGKSIEAAFVSRNCTLLHDMRGLYLYNENEGLYQARNKFEYIFGKNDIVCSSFFGTQRDFDVDKADIVFASFQSLNNHRQKWYELFDKNHFDFIIVNEGHHSSAVTYREVIDYFNCSKIAMTATPKRMDGKNILHIFEEIIFEMSLEEAIARAWVAKVEYHICSHGISSQKLKKICAEVLEEGKRITIKQLNETIFVKKLNESILEEIYKHAFPQYETPLQTIIFCENIKHAEETIAILKDGKKSVEIIHSKKTSIHNHNALENFKENKFQFLIVVDKLNEDIDIPNVELAIFLRATDSQTVFLQQLGRVLRRTKFKDTAIILDFVANCERLLMVNEMMEKISNFSQQIGKNTGSNKNNKKQLEKGLLYVSGEGHDFKIEKESVILYDLLKRIDVDFYKTWQEASEVIIKAGVQSQEDYDNRYKSISNRLPSSSFLLRYYTDFPGWNIFLGKTLPPEGWLTINNMHELGEFNQVKWEKIKLFLYEYRIQFPEKFGKFFSVIGRENEYYSPDVLDVLRKQFPLKVKVVKIKNSIERAPEGWSTANDLLKKHDLIGTPLSIELFAENYRNSNQNWFGLYYSGNGNYLHFHPKLCTFLIKEFSKSNRIIAPNGWMTPVKVKNKYNLPGTYNKIVLFADKFKEEHPEWFNFFMSGFHYCEHYHSDLCSKIVEKFSLKGLENWQTRNNLKSENNLNVSLYTMKNFADKFKREHPEWFKLHEGEKRIVEYYHPDLVQKIKEHFKKRKLNKL